MTDDDVTSGPGPGAGPGGVPAAIALTPILSARYRPRDLEIIREASPGSRIVTIGFDGHADGPLLGACHRAEAFLRTWQDTLPFGRPLA